MENVVRIAGATVSGSACSSSALKIGDRFLDRPPLARRAEFGALGDIEIVLAVDHGAQGDHGDFRAPAIKRICW